MIGPIFIYRSLAVILWLHSNLARLIRIASTEFATLLQTKRIETLISSGTARSYLAVSDSLS